MTPSVSLMLVYEPATSQQGPVPLARVEDPDLAVMVARSAICAAESRASELSRSDTYLGEVERAEAQRLRQVLMLLIPGLKNLDKKLSPALTHLTVRFSSQTKIRRLPQVLLSTHHVWI